MSIRTRNQQILSWILLTEALLIISTRLAAFLHEFVGHGLLALLFGGSFEAFRLTLFAGGEARFSGDFSEIARLSVSLGGIAVNLASGLSALWLIQMCRRSFAFTLFGMIFAGVSVLSQLQYLILGSYYRHGDPVGLTPYPVALWLAWTAGLAALAFSSLYLMRLFFQFQDACFPRVPLFKRALISLLILGIPVGLYAGLYHSFRTDLASMAANQEARSRIYQEAVRIQSETGSEQSIAEIIEELTPHPILPWVLAVYLSTTLIAFFSPAKATKEKFFPDSPTPLLPALLWLICAGFLLALIAWIWGW